MSEYGSGGGATHVAIKTGELSEFRDDVYSVLIVAGGGGGGGDYDTDCVAGNGGGFVGQPPKYRSSDVLDRSGTQSQGNAFGYGEFGCETGGGGGGYYGGYAGHVGYCGAGSGSGFINNDSLGGDKKMYGYDVPATLDPTCKTYSIQVVNARPRTATAKIGDGHVRIKFVSSVSTPVIGDITVGVPNNWNGSECAILWSGNSNKLTMTNSSSGLNFKFYTGDTIIYSFHSDTSTNHFQVSFLKDDDHQVAKPSFIYSNAFDTAFSYNQETPTYAEMQALYTWLQPGLNP